MDAYSKHESLDEARAVALAQAKATGKKHFIACSSGFSVVQSYKLFATAGYYVASPDGAFGWEGDASYAGTI